MALYFPQFHEIEENNHLWGKGFTEWTLINNYKGEIKKPHVDIDQYNMLDYQIRKKQGIIAKKHGIHAFCYYHYWFKDRKVMYKGIEKILEDGEPNMPFALCWANEPWTRNWDGIESEILINQEYGTKEDWLIHYNYLLKFFKHPNYIKEDNCPILYIYRIEHMNQNKALKMLKLWKKMIKKDGFDGLKIISILGNFNKTTNPGLDTYIDGYAEHQPTYNSRKSKLLFMNNLQHNLDTQEFYKEIINNEKIGDNYSRGIFYSWDNSSRRFNKKSYKFINLSYKAFEELIIKTIINISRKPNKNNNYILLNSWNEWSEQAMVEPNDHDGYNILKIFQKIFGNQEKIISPI